jgi:hypothetical protein
MIELDELVMDKLMAELDLEHENGAFHALPGLRRWCSGVVGSGVTGSSVDEALARYVLLHKVNSWISNVAWVFLHVTNPCPFCCEHTSKML